jgi:hypothetical protein
MVLMQLLVRLGNTTQEMYKKCGKSGAKWAKVGQKLHKSGATIIERR